MTTQSSQVVVLINGFGVLFVILNSFGLGLRLSVGKLLGEAFTHWKIAVWALVINFVIIPLVFIGYLLTIAESIPGEIKVGFCVAALCAGMPFAPLLARLAKADVSISTTLLVLLTAATIIALPVGLPLAIDAVDAQLKTSAWDIAWPLLLFMLLPLVLGCGFRVWWPDLTPPLAQWVVRVAILCLLFNLNFTLVAYWDLFVETWGTESYVAAFAGPFIGLGCGYLLVPSLRVKDVGDQACGRGDDGGTQHRSDAPDDDLSLCSRPAGHGVDHNPQHHRHHDRSSVRPDVEARCFNIGHPRNNQRASNVSRDVDEREVWLLHVIGACDSALVRLEGATNPTIVARAASTRLTRAIACREVDGACTAPAPSGRLLGSWWRTPGYSGSGDPRLDVGVVVGCIPVSEPAPDKQQRVARHVVGAVALGVETVGYELLAGATLTTAAATAGMGAGHHVAGSAFDTVGATTVGSGFHQAGDALYAVARKSFALAGDAARSAMDSFAGPPQTQVDEQPPN